MMILDDQNIMIREILAMANEMSRLWLQIFSNQKPLRMAQNLFSKNQNDNVRATVWVLIGVAPDIQELLLLGLL